MQNLFSSEAIPYLLVTDGHMPSEIYAETESRNFVNIGLSLGGEVPAWGSVELCTTKLEGIWVVPTLQWLVPGFPWGRPRSVILHCLNRQSRSNKYQGGDLSEGGKEGVFTLQKTDGTKTLAGAHQNRCHLFPAKAGPIAPSMQTLLHSVSTKASIVLGCITTNV